MYTGTWNFSVTTLHGCDWTHVLFEELACWSPSCWMSTGTAALYWLFYIKDDHESFCPTAHLSRQAFYIAHCTQLWPMWYDPGQDLSKCSTCCNYDWFCIQFGAQQWHLRRTIWQCAVLTDWLTCWASVSMLVIIYQLWKACSSKS